MEQLLYGLAVLACPVGMGVMMWMMNRGGKKKGDSGAHTPTGSAPDSNSARELAQLRSEVEWLKADRAGAAPERNG